MKRYRPRQLQISGPTMAPTEEGTGPVEWVRYKDAAELQRRLDAIVDAMEPGPMPTEDQYQFSLRPTGDYKHAHDKWTARQHLHARIKAIAEGKP